jgi:hypothetical protein
MPLFSTNLSSAGTAQVALSWITPGSPTSIGVTIAANSSGDFFLQTTFDDLQRSSAPVWVGLSSEPLTAPAVLAATHYNASAATLSPDGVRVVYPGAIGGVRLNSTSLTGTLTLKVVQPGG